MTNSPTADFPLTDPVSTALAPIETQFWIWRDHRIAYATQGSGIPLILIHGFGASIGHWRQNLPVLAAAGYRVIAIDLLGFGKSDKPLLDYSIELWQALLADFWTALVQQPAVFIGNSIGALLSLSMLAHHPEMARGGVLLNAAGGLNHRPEELNLPLRLVMGGFAKLVSSDLFGPFLFNRIRQKSRLRQTLYQVYRDRAAVTDELIDLLYQPSCDPGAQKVFAAILSAPAGPRPEALLPQISQPLLVLWGEADPWTPIAGAQLYRQLADQSSPAAHPATHPATHPVCQVKFVPIPDTGHCPHDERPEIVNAEIIQWLSSVAEPALA